MTATEDTEHGARPVDNPVDKVCRIARHSTPARHSVSGCADPFGTARHSWRETARFRG